MAKKELTPKQKRIRNAKVISAVAGTAGQFISGKGSEVPLSTSANDDNPADVIPESVVNQDKKELTTDLEEKTPSSFLSNYDIA